MESAELYLRMKSNFIPNSDPQAAVEGFLRELILKFKMP